jgi:hypothetical protein
VATRAEVVEEIVQTSKRKVKEAANEIVTAMQKSKKMTDRTVSGVAWS